MSKNLDKMYYITIKTIGNTVSDKELKTFGYIYAIVNTTTKKGLPVKQALEKIRKILDKK